MTIAIFGKRIDSDYNYFIYTIIEYLKSNDYKIVFYKPFCDFLNNNGLQIECNDTFTCNYDIPQNTNFVFSIGGDGTFLEAVSIVKHLEIPIVGFNSGRLGFLADISQENITRGLISIFSGNYTVEERMLIQVEGPKELFTENNIGLNEFTIQKSSPQLITCHTFIDDLYLNSYWADGIIISTPTGSTAYSLSAGGPILLPNLDNFVITPISPHNLTMRPIVVSGKSKIRIEIEGRDDSCLASIDSRNAKVDINMKIFISKAEFKAKILKLKNHDFYSTLRSKLMWGADKRN